MAIRVKDYELFELAYNSNVANPEKLTYVNSRGDEFTVLSESCQTDESWIEYVDEYRNIIADNTEHHSNNNNTENSKNTKNDKKSTKLPRIQSATSRFANPTANRPQTFHNENSRKKLETLHMKSRRKIVSMDDIGSDGSDEFGSTDRSVRFQGFSENSDENEDKLTELSKKPDSDMDLNRKVGARSALDVAISQHCLTNTAAMVQSKIYGNINPGYMDNLALAGLGRNSTRHTLNKEEIRPLLDDYVTTSYRYSDTQGPIHIKRSSVNRASIKVAEDCAKKRLECEKLNHDKRTAELALKKLKMMQKQKQLNTLKSYGSKFNKAYSPEEKSNWSKMQEGQTNRRTTARFSVVTKSTVKKQDRDYEEMIDNSNSDEGDRYGGRKTGHSVHSNLHNMQGRRDSFDTVSAAIQSNDKGQDTIKFSLNTAACRKWVNIPKDQGLIFEAKQQLEGIPDDLSSIPLNLMMAEMAGKLEELISDTQKKARRIVKNKDQIGKDCESSTDLGAKYKIKKSTNFNSYNNSSNAANHVKESASRTSQSGHDKFSSNANLFKNPVLRDVLEWRGVGRTSVVTLEGGDSNTSINQMSMGGIVGAKRKVRTAILQRFVKMNIKAVKENYKKPNGMDLFHVTTYVTDQWSNKNFTKVYYYPKTKTEREYNKENSRPAIILFSNQKQHLQPCVIVNVFDEKTGKIFATGNNTHCIWIDGRGFFDCSTHLLTLFSTDRKSSFYQEKFKIKINENISLKYDGKKKRVSFCFEYTKLGMPSVDLDLPLGDRDEGNGAGNSKSISLVDSRRTRRTGYKNVIAIYLVQQRSKINKLLKEMNNARQGMSMVSGKARNGKVESGKVGNNSRLEKACKVKKTKSDAKIQEKLQVAMQRNANANLSYFLPILKIHSEPKTPKKVIKIEF